MSNFLHRNWYIKKHSSEFLRELSMLFFTQLSSMSRFRLLYFIWHISCSTYSRFFTYKCFSLLYSQNKELKPFSDYFCFAFWLRSELKKYLQLKVSQDSGQLCCAHAWGAARVRRPRHGANTCGSSGNHCRPSLQLLARQRSHNPPRKGVARAHSAFKKRTLENILK